jgi:glutathione S-transferase
MSLLLPVAIERFRKETFRVFGVLEIRLSGVYTGEPREYLAGNGKGKYSIADIGTWTWVKNWKRSGYTDEEMSAFPHLLKWIDRVAERPAVQRGTGEKYAQ